MKEKFTQWLARIDALSLRERGLFLFVMVFVIYLAWDNVLVGSLDTERNQLARQIGDVRAQTAKIEAQVQATLSAHSLDPDRENRERLKQLKSELPALDTQLKDMTLGLIEPRQMSKVLEQVLRRDTDLHLVRIESLAPRPLIDATTKEAGTQGEDSQLAGVYKHGLAIEFEGTYLDTLRYLKVLEGLPWQFYWDNVELHVDSYPDAHVTITVYTLSLREGWIGV